jgi:predicted RNase H-like HicB family nuclease
MDTKKPPPSARIPKMHFNLETEREEDGRWIAEITDMPGVMAYGETEEQAKANAIAVALRGTQD